MRRTPPNNATAAWLARRARNQAPQAEAEPEKIPFNELRAQAVAAGVSAAGTRADIEGRLAALEED